MGCLVTKTIRSERLIELLNDAYAAGRASAIDPELGKRVSERVIYESCEAQLIVIGNTHHGRSGYGYVTLSKYSNGDPCTIETIRHGIETVVNEEARKGGGA
jgi:hypothetical protein